MKVLAVTTLVLLSAGLAHASDISSERCTGNITNSTTSEARSLDFTITGPADAGGVVTLTSDGVSVKAKVIEQADPKLGVMQIRTSDTKLDWKTEAVAEGSSEKLRFYKLEIQQVDENSKADGSPFTGLLSCQDL